MLSDSIPKYISAKYTEVTFHKGYKILQLADKTRFDNEVDIQGCDFILIMVDTNDISELITKSDFTFLTVHDIMARYHALNKVICKRNRHAIILFSSILPRADNFDLYFPLIFGLNFALEKWCLCIIISKTWQTKEGTIFHYGWPTPKWGRH